jgi:Icc-related predicted phosphoesterase
MRIFATSDIHVDYEANASWVANLSTADFRDDVLILAGDISDSLRLLGWCLGAFSERFKKVFFVPGNHDLWVVRDSQDKNSFDKFRDVMAVARSSGACTESLRMRRVSIVPLLGWYDYSFGDPSEELKSVWMDYHACRWPAGFGVPAISAHFAALNRGCDVVEGDKIITFSHFLPRIDLMPAQIPKDQQKLYPVLGTIRLEEQLRRINPSIHVYGHSHVNRRVSKQGVAYINNAFGYPREAWITSKQLLCIHEC